jgi:hypothetical protein
MFWEAGNGRQIGIFMKLDNREEEKLAIVY